MLRASAQTSDPLAQARMCGWALTAALALVGCEDDAVFQVPEPVDAGFVVDAGRQLRDAGFLAQDAGFPDTGFPPVAEQPVYIHDGDRLFSYDPETNFASSIGVFHDSNGPLDLDVVDIAIDLDGIMYGGTRGGRGDPSGNRVYVIDPESAFARLVFEFDDTLNGMTFLDDGRLVIAGERVSVVDARSGRLLLEFSGAQDYETSGDIVGLPDGKLYWTVRGDDADDVVRIDPATGRLENLGSAQLRSIYGLGYAQDQLFGFSSTGFVVVIDPRTGRVLRQERLEGRWFGATTNPVRWE